MHNNISPQRLSLVFWRHRNDLLAYGHIGPKTVLTRDTSTPVPKCGSVRTLRHQGTSAPRKFDPNGETVRTIGPDTSVLGPGHFGTGAKVSSYCDYGGTSPRQCNNKDFTQRTHRKQRRCLRCLRCVDCAKLTASKSF